MLEYEDKFADIPRDYEERLNWMYDKYEIDDTISCQILQERQNFINTTQYDTITFTLWEEPIATPRPRASIVNKRGILNAFEPRSYIHIRQEGAAENHAWFEMYVREHLSKKISQMVSTSCYVRLASYMMTPVVFSKTDVFLAEIGLIRPLIKPDLDNITKCSLDMFNGNILLDDMLVTDLAVSKYYSVLPRTEVILSWANQLANAYQYRAIVKRKDFLPNMSVTYIGSI